MDQENTQIDIAKLNHDNNLNNNTVISRNTANLSWLGIRIKSVNQLTSLIAPFLILIASGINFPRDLYLLVQILWIIGGIFGAISASILIHQIRKIIIYRISCFALFISGILFMFSENSNGIRSSAMFIGGFYYGLTFVTALIHASEISIKQLRGWFVTGIVLSILLGNFIMSTLSIISPNMNYGLIILISMLILGFLSLLFLHFWSLESPAFLIEKHNKILALKTLLKLHKEIEETSETQEDFLELNEMVNARTTNSNIFAIFIIILSRIFFNSMAGVLRFHAGFNFGFLGMCIVGVILSILLIEKLGRKRLLITSNVITGLCIFGISISRLIPNQYKYSTITEIVICISGIIFLVFLGIGLSVSTTYLTEIFPFKYKSYLIAFTIIAENITFFICKYLVYYLHITTPYLRYELVENILGLLNGCFTILIGILSIFFLPETKSLSLNECSKKRK